MSCVLFDIAAGSRYSSTTDVLCAFISIDRANKLNTEQVSVSVRLKTENEASNGHDHLYVFFFQAVRTRVAQAPVHEGGEADGFLE